MLHGTKKYIFCCTCNIDLLGDETMKILAYFEAIFQYALITTTKMSEIFEYKAIIYYTLERGS